jgi:hypothetical protein
VKGNAGTQRRFLEYESESLASKQLLRPTVLERHGRIKNAVNIVKGEFGD